MSQSYMLPKQAQYVMNDPQGQTQGVNPMSQSLPAFDINKLLASLQAPFSEQQTPIQQAPATMQPAQIQPTQQQTVPATPVTAPVRGTAANPSYADDWFGAGAGDKSLGISAILGTLAGAIGGGDTIGGRMGQAMSGISQGELAARNQAENQQQMMQLWQALLQSNRTF